jgi:hypothetical protein
MSAAVTDTERQLVERLDDQELAVLETALRKVTVDCTFG